MNRENYVTAVVAVLCVFAVGLSATSLDQALGTDPDDVVDLEYEKLPIGQGDAGDLQREVRSNKEEGQGAGGGGSGPEADSSSGDDSSSQSDSGDGDENAADSADGSDSGGGQTSAGDTTDGSGALPGLSKGTPDDPLWLLPWLALLAALALAYRYRRRLLSLTLAFLGVVPEQEEVDEEITAEWHGVEPSNDIHRAWLTLVDSIPVERPWTRTPSECADIALASGADPEAVEHITETFEEVRYGGRPVTDERRERAREGIERLRTRGERQ